MRTTLDIDTPILEEVKQIREEEGRSLGRIVSDLLASALATRKRRQPAHTNLSWNARSLGARVDISDKDALYRALESES